MRKAYISALYDLANKDKRIMAIISDNGAIIYDKYREDLQKQYFNFGISEANMIGAAAGMASCGLIPFVYTISNFMTMRAFEFIRNDVCLNNANVKVVGTGAGFAYSKLGSTHHATEDIALMRALPNMVILSPSCPLETKRAVVAASEIDSPVYLRIGTGNNPEFYENTDDYLFEIGKGIELRGGSDVSIIATGTIIEEALKTHDSLKAHGVSVRVINIHTITPIDKDIIIKAAKETKGIITLEEHSIIGGLGDAVGDILLKSSVRLNFFEKVGLKGFSKSYGDYAYMKKINEIDNEYVTGIIKTHI